ncbi:hypothetical protein Q3G72_010245 [Acer saccharum]|nr:hypothetical protein Q3G72_010245 [Acer saccharum]
MKEKSEESELPNDYETPPHQSVKFNPIRTKTLSNIQLKSQLVRSPESPNSQESLTVPAILKPGQNNLSNHPSQQTNHAKVPSVVSESQFKQAVDKEFIVYTRKKKTQNEAEVQVQ